MGQGYTCHPITWEFEAEGLQQVQGQPELHSETLLQKHTDTRSGHQVIFLTSLQAQEVWAGARHGPQPAQQHTLPSVPHQLPNGRQVS